MASSRNGNGRVQYDEEYSYNNRRSNRQSRRPSRGNKGRDMDSRDLVQLPIRIQQPTSAPAGAIIVVAGSFEDLSPEAQQMLATRDSYVQQSGINTRLAR